MSELHLSDERVRAALASVVRGDFLGEDQRPYAHEDRPLGIGEGQTTSQPSLIAWTLEQLHLTPESRALEVGTGCGYQTALLARLCAQVYSIDIIEPLVVGAAERLGALGYRNVHLRAGDGYRGWPEAAPFDAIVVAAGAQVIPPPLVAQLAPGGRLIIPIGDAEHMSLVRLTRAPDGSSSEERLLSVRFVPLTGLEAERDRG